MQSLPHQVVPKWQCWIWGVLLAHWWFPNQRWKHQNSQRCSASGNTTKDMVKSCGKSLLTWWNFNELKCWTNSVLRQICIVLSSCHVWKLLRLARSQSERCYLDSVFQNLHCGGGENHPEVVPEMLAYMLIVMWVQWDQCTCKMVNM